MKKFAIPLFILFSSSAFPVQQDIDLKQVVNNTLGTLCTISRHLTDVTDVLLLGDNLANGKHHDPGVVRVIHNKTRQIQKGMQQVSLLNRQLHDPTASRVHVGLLLVKKIEEVLILIRDAV